MRKFKNNIEVAQAAERIAGKEAYDAVIVGAGLAGLSCAYELTAKGKKVLVLEKQMFAGGRTSSFTDEGMRVESGLHRYIGYYTAMPRLLKKCGTKISNIVTWEDKVDIPVPKYGSGHVEQINGSGRSSKVVLGLAPVWGPIKTLRGVLGNRELLSWRDKMSLVPFFVCGFASYFFSEKLDEISVTDYANKHNVSENGKRLVLEPLSSGIFFLPPENYSAYAFFGLFMPSLPKFYKMRIGAFLGGMSDVLCEPIVRRAAELGGEFRFGEQVETVLVEQGRVVGVRTADGKEYRTKQVVVATTLNAAKQILRRLDSTSTEIQKLFALPTMSSCTLQLELNEPALEKDITNFGPGTDMVSFAEQSRSTFRASKGRLSVIFGNPAEYVKKSTEELVPIVISEMERLGIHLKGKILDARKVTEENEFYSLACGSQKLRPMQNSGVPGLVLAGDYTLTYSFATMESAVVSGRKAAEVCLASL